MTQSTQAPQDRPLIYGLTRAQIDEFQSQEPLEVSVFIGGREFPLRGIALQNGASLRSELIRERDELATILRERPESERWDDDEPLEETKLFLAERLLYLDHLITEVTNPPRP